MSYRLRWCSWEKNVDISLRRRPIRFMSCSMCMPSEAVWVGFSPKLVFELTVKHRTVKQGCRSLSWSCKESICRLSIVDGAHSLIASSPWQLCVLLTPLILVWSTGFTCDLKYEIWSQTRNTFCRTRNLSNATFSFLITWRSSSSKSAAVYKISSKSDFFRRDMAI